MFLSKLENSLLFLTILFLPTQLGRHFWPQFSYIYSLKIDYLSPTLYFWDLLVAGLFLVWLFRKPKINMLALTLFLFFLFTQILSLPGSFNVGAGLVRLEQYSLAGLFGVYIASVIPRVAVATRGNLDVSEGKESSAYLRKIATSSHKAGPLAMTSRELIYLPLALGILGESVITILQFIKGSTLGLWILGERSFTLSTPGIAKFDFYGQQFLRPYATFPHPNVLAGFMLLSIVILSSFLCHSERLAKNLPVSWKILWSLHSLRTTLLKVLGLIAGIVVFLTMSRTVILAGFLTTVMLLKRKWIIFIIIITFILSPILFTRYSSLLSFDNLTLLRREELAGSAWQMFLKSPVFGIGLNNFIPAMANQLVTGPSRFLQPVHNIFLLALSETGVIGLIGLIGLIGYPIFKLYSYRLGLTALLPWVVIIFLGMFDHYFLTLPQGYRLLFLVWGLSLSMLK